MVGKSCSSLQVHEFLLESITWHHYYCTSMNYQACNYKMFKITTNSITDHDDNKIIINKWNKNCKVLLWEIKNYLTLFTSFSYNFLFFILRYFRLMYSYCIVGTLAWVFFRVNGVVLIV